ncbi:hypothetical protein QR680_009927 [Steinernema hermaphroditum]|uniref:Uncharacterized protein n=1 Tax=Steinernema hermaphroditum TaxID=289476 RepID=A0AA39MAA8_9BILA|nr:hypothetical protein QR680_009927 [Steinernema hermaphroditum]
MEHSKWNGCFQDCRHSLVPVYASLIWVFATKSEFRSLVAYQIIINLGLLDCLYLIESLIAGIFTLTWPHFDEDWDLYYDWVDNKAALLTIGSVISCCRSGYLHSFPMMSLILAFNRLTVMLRVKATKLSNRIYMALIALSWIVSIPLMLYLHFGDFGIFFDFLIDGFTYSASEQFSNFMGYNPPALEAGVLLCTLGVIVTVAVQKKIYGSTFKISSLEIRLVIQSLLITVPLSIVNIIGLRFADYFDQYAWLHISWHGLATLIPAINLTVYIIFNPIARKYLWDIVSRRKVPSRVVTIALPTTTGSMRSSISMKGSMR